MKSLWEATSSDKLALVHPPPDFRVHTMFSYDTFLMTFLQALCVTTDSRGLILGQCCDVVSMLSLRLCNAGFQ